MFFQKSVISNTTYRSRIKFSPETPLDIVLEMPPRKLSVIEFFIIIFILTRKPTNKFQINKFFANKFIIKFFKLNLNIKFKT